MSKIYMPQSEAHIPQWFLKELLVIDRTYFVKWNKHWEYYTIHKRMNINRIDQETGICVNIKNPIVATFKHLNHTALDNLRKRKRLGEKFNAKPHDPYAYLKFIVKQNKESKEKAKALAREMIAKGFMKIHKLETSKMFDMGGH